MTVAGVAGIIVLVLAWAGPLPGLVQSSFAAHMALHMLVTGVAAPLLAAGLAPQVVRRGGVAIPVMASLLDFAVIWGWHAPALHEAARTGATVLAMEQASFLVVSVTVWVVALAAPPLIGMLELLFTSMHMVFLGALIGLAPRAKYHDHGQALVDQQVGGAIMLGVGGVVYLAGGLWIAANLLRLRPAR